MGKDLPSQAGKTDVELSGCRAPPATTAAAAAAVTVAAGC